LDIPIIPRVGNFRTRRQATTRECRVSKNNRTFRANNAGRQRSRHFLAHVTRDQYTFRAFTALYSTTRRHTRAFRNHLPVVATASTPRLSASLRSKATAVSSDLDNPPTILMGAAVTLPPHVLMDLARRPRQAKRLGVQTTTAEFVFAPPRGT
jgi:hypothetical protein